MTWATDSMEGFVRLLDEPSERAIDPPSGDVLALDMVRVLSSCSGSLAGAVGCLLLDGGGDLRRLDLADVPADDVALAEERCREGPGHDAFVDDRWVLTARRSQAHARLMDLLPDDRAGMVVAAPLRLQGGPIGALTLRTADQQGTAGAMRTLRTLAQEFELLLGTALRTDEAGSASDGSPVASGLCRQLHAALQSRPIMERAAAVIAGTRDWDVGRAALRLRQWALDAGVTPVELARETVHREAAPTAARLAQLAAAERARRHDLARLALTDPLTGLANRTLFEDRLELALARSRRHRGSSAILYVDLDHFKLINDAIGHSAGDEVLRSVAVRLTAAVRPEDTVARLGGDEFAILCEELEGTREAERVARRITRHLEEPVPVSRPAGEGAADGADERVSVAASIGISLVAPEQSSAQIMHEADVAMYRAKRGSLDPRVRSAATVADVLEDREVGSGAVRLGGRPEQEREREGQ